MKLSTKSIRSLYGTPAKHRSLRRYYSAGFSLIELIIVVAVLATLAAIAIPAFNNVARNARSTSAKTSLSNVYKECEVSKADVGTATHTALAATAGGVTYTGDAVLTTCTGVATGTTSDNCAYSITLTTGAKAATAAPCAQW